MISTLRGRLTHRSASGVVIETGGVGYEVQVPLRVLSNLPPEGSEVFLYIHTYVKDGQISLYGFQQESDRAVFRSLLGVSGIGPRLALNILSATTADEFYRAVDSEDTAILSRLPGIGRKKAKRIIFELKQTLPATDKIQDTVYEDILSALVNLGYRASEAKEALQKVYQKDMGIEDALKEALRYLNREAE